MVNDYIDEITHHNFDEWFKMGLELWPDNNEADLREIFLSILHSKKEKAFICRTGDTYTGFINVSIRSDYVEGSSSSPVGYVEGIYVKPPYRNKGIARKLIRQGEEWSRSKSCSQMASDTELNNTASFDFHNRIGFKEANRIICLIKDIV